MAMSHANCTHPATPAARSACRKIRNAMLDGTAFAPAFLVPEIKMTGPVARRMARQAVKADNARIQPRRSGARVSTRGASCVQAALHVDAHGGRCACGWEAAA